MHLNVHYVSGAVSSTLDTFSNQNGQKSLLFQGRETNKQLTLPSILKGDECYEKKEKVEQEEGNQECGSEEQFKY